MEFSYPENIELIFQYTMNTEFIDLEDFMNIFSNFINKENSIISNSKKYINDYFDILKKCYNIKQLKIPQGVPYTYNNYYEKYIYDNDYWYNLFGKKLNKDELALYYTFFIYKYHKFNKEGISSKEWSCIMHPNGFIKSFGYHKYSDLYISENDIIIKIDLYYNYNSTSKQHSFTENYWSTKIKLENKHGVNIENSIINLELLEQMIINKNFVNKIIKIKI